MSRRWNTWFAAASTGSAMLDASQGSAILQTTPGMGQVTASTTNSVTMTLQALDGQPPSVFNFAGTGTSSAQDTSAAGNVASVPAGLLTVPVTVGSEITLYGFVTPFGSAPPDFASLSLANYANTTARLQLQFNSPGITAPFVAPLSATHVLIAQSTLQSAARHVISVDFQRLDPAAPTTGLSLVANTTATDTAFAIAHSLTHTMDTFGTFAALIAALATDLNGTIAMLEVDATGPYDATTGVFSVNSLVVRLNN